jgi:hypothetical protein
MVLETKQGLRRYIQRLFVPLIRVIVFYRWEFLALVKMLNRRRNLLKMLV